MAYGKLGSPTLDEEAIQPTKGPERRGYYDKGNLRNSISFPPDLWEWLDQKAREENTSLSTVVREICRDAMEAQEKADEAE